MRHALASFAMISALSCSQRPGSESAYATRLPDAIRPSYELFAHRCSKCHSLARPLDSGIDDDASWELYVDRMRRQPGSGISMSDRAPILAFLRYYALKQRRQRAAASAEPSPDAQGGMK
jgi:hypothetical protein